ncbi:MAG: cytochrome c maturation protein CcmE [Flavobacteriales bacterium]|nr:cytochrome c maturation protein CcmE [Flavobacteriales bacterium]
MKKIHIVLIILVALVSAILVSTYTSANSSVTFADAQKKPGREYKISGTFDRDQALEHNPLEDANLTIFNMKDKAGTSQKVFLHSKEGKPMDIERSESVDLFGAYNADGEFHADEILMKCPSKYNSNKHELETASK